MKKIIIILVLLAVVMTFGCHKKEPSMQYPTIQISVPTEWQIEFYMKHVEGFVIEKQPVVTSESLTETLK